MKAAFGVKLRDLNPHLICVLCGGYLIQATTIVECFHSFCRSCIIRYLETSNSCPICDVQVHKARPHLNIREDKTLQDLVYKLVPGLYHKELKRRQSFYDEHPREDSSEYGSSSDDVTSSDEDYGRQLQECDVISFDYPPAISKSENISVCLQLCARSPPFKNSCSTTSPHKDEDILDKKYLLCPATFPLGLMKKFVQAKFNLSQSQEVEFYFSDESLSDNCRLMDVAYVYHWKKFEPLKLFYIVQEKPKVIKKEKGEITAEIGSTEEATKPAVVKGQKPSSPSKERSPRKTSQSSPRSPKAMCPTTEVSLAKTAGKITEVSLAKTSGKTTELSLAKTSGKTTAVSPAKIPGKTSAVSVAKIQGKPTEVSLAKLSGKTTEVSLAKRSGNTTEMSPAKTLGKTTEVSLAKAAEKAKTPDKTTTATIAKAPDETTVVCAAKSLDIPTTVSLASLPGQPPTMHQARPTAHSAAMTPDNASSTVTTVVPPRTTGHTAVMTSAPASGRTAMMTSAPASSHTAMMTSAPASGHTAMMTSAPASSHTAMMTSAPASSHTAMMTSAPTSSHTAMMTSAPVSGHTAMMTSAPVSGHTASPVQAATNVAPTTGRVVLCAETSSKQGERQETTTGRQQENEANDTPPTASSSTSCAGQGERCEGCSCHSAECQGQGQGQKQTANSSSPNTHLQSSVYAQPATNQNSNVGCDPKQKSTYKSDMLSNETFSPQGSALTATRPGTSLQQHKQAIHSALSKQIKTTASEPANVNKLTDQSVTQCLSDCKRRNIVALSADNPRKASNESNLLLQTNTPQLGNAKIISHQNEHKESSQTVLLSKNAKRPQRLELDNPGRGFRSAQTDNTAKNGEGIAEKFQTSLSGGSNKSAVSVLPQGTSRDMEEEEDRGSVHAEPSPKKTKLEHCGSAVHCGGDAGADRNTRGPLSDSLSNQNRQTKSVQVQTENALDENQRIHFRDDKPGTSNSVNSIQTANDRSSLTPACPVGSTPIRASLPSPKSPDSSTGPKAVPPESVDSNRRRKTSTSNFAKKYRLPSKSVKGDGKVQSALRSIKLKSRGKALHSGSDPYLFMSDDNTSGNGMKNPRCSEPSSSAELSRPEMGGEAESRNALAFLEEYVNFVNHGEGRANDASPAMEPVSSSVQVRFAAVSSSSVVRAVRAKNSLQKTYIPLKDIVSANTALQSRMSHGTSIRTIAGLYERRKAQCGGAKVNVTHAALSKVTQAPMSEERPQGMPSPQYVSQKMSMQTHTATQNPTHSPTHKSPTPPHTPTPRITTRTHVPTQKVSIRTHIPTQNPTHSPTHKLPTPPHTPTQSITTPTHATTRKVSVPTPTPTQKPPTHTPTQNPTHTPTQKPPTHTPTQTATTPTNTPKPITAMPKLTTPTHTPTQKPPTPTHTPTHERPTTPHTPTQEHNVENRTDNDESCSKNRKMPPLKLKIPKSTLRTPVEEDRSDQTRKSRHKSETMDDHHPRICLRISKTNVPALKRSLSTNCPIIEKSPKRQSPRKSRTRASVGEKPEMCNVAPKQLDGCCQQDVTKTTSMQHVGSNSSAVVSHISPKAVSPIKREFDFNLKPEYSREVVGTADNISDISRLALKRKHSDGQDYPCVVSDVSSSTQPESSVTSQCKHSASVTSDNKTDLQSRIDKINALKQDLDGRSPQSGLDLLSRASEKFSPIPESRIEDSQYPITDAVFASQQDHVASKERSISSSPKLEVTACSKGVAVEPRRPSTCGQPSQDILKSTRKTLDETTHGLNKGCSSEDIKRTVKEQRELSKDSERPPKPRVVSSGNDVRLPVKSETDLAESADSTKEQGVPVVMPSSSRHPAPTPPISSPLPSPLMMGMYVGARHFLSPHMPYHGLVYPLNGLVMVSAAASRHAHVTPRLDHVTPRLDHVTPRLDHVTPRPDHTAAGSDHVSLRTSHATQGQEHEASGLDHVTAKACHVIPKASRMTGRSDHVTTRALSVPSSPVTTPLFPARTELNLTKELGSRCVPLVSNTRGSKETQRSLDTASLESKTNPCLSSASQRNIERGRSHDDVIKAVHMNAFQRANLKPQEVLVRETGLPQASGFRLHTQRPCSEPLSSHQCSQYSSQATPVSRALMTSTSCHGNLQANGYDAPLELTTKKSPK